MSEASRAGWHAQHLRHGDAQSGQPASSNTRGDRRRLLKEAMRALDESDAARQAARNPSIVAADTHLNRAYVNDDEGGFRELSPEEGVEPVLEYGDGRINSVRRKWHPRAFETTTIVSWVPKSLLVEIPDYYPVYDAKTKKEIGRRSRWVMPDDGEGKAEVDRWFAETHAHLTEDVLTGGHDAVHGVVWNFDESVPHVHWMCDTLAPLQKDLEISAGAERVMIDAAGEPVVKYKKVLTLDKVVPLAKDLDGNQVVAAAPEVAADRIAGIDRHGYLVGADGQRLPDVTGRPVRASDDLKVEAQQMWGQSGEVTEARMVDGVEKRVKITGATKLSNYQEVYRERLVEAGFDIELEVNPEGTSLDKAAFGASEAEKMAVSAEAEKVAAERAELDRRSAYVSKEMERLDAREEALEARDAALTESERRAETERQRGYTDGRAQGAAAWEAENGESYRAQVRGDVEADIRAQAESVITDAQTEAGQIVSSARTKAAAIRQDSAERTQAEEQCAREAREAAESAQREVQERLARTPDPESEAARLGTNRWIHQAMRTDKRTFASEGKSAWDHYVAEGQKIAQREKSLGRNVDIRQTEGQRKKAMSRTLGDAASKSAEHSRRQRQSDDRSYGQE